MMMIMMNGDANTNEFDFSRFCLHSTTSVKRERLQINMNVKDIFLKKKQTWSSQVHPPDAPGRFDQIGRLREIGVLVGDDASLPAILFIVE